MFHVSRFTFHVFTYQAFDKIPIGRHRIRMGNGFLSRQPHYLGDLGGIEVKLAADQLRGPSPECERAIGRIPSPALSQWPDDHPKLLAHLADEGCLKILTDLSRAAGKADLQRRQ